MTLGHELQLPLDLHIPPNAPATSTVGEYTARMIDILRTTHDLARQHLKTYQEAEIRVHDQLRLGAPFQVGDSVWLHQELPPRGRPSKFHHPWVGPFVIITVLPNNVYRIRSLRTGQDLVVHYGRLKPGTGDFNRTNGNLIPAGEIPVAETIDIPPSHWGQWLRRQGGIVIPARFNLSTSQSPYWN